ncbi:hypothetical protein [Saccharomonospora iraqiensis]|uniref:hypothetical protein n=1 Tax=Saccharomonospora iraqiensis TaxID=52698 RepID=UPI0004274CA5|nr:hypothetical protein [Saccharomonospora iraqiensis]
MNGFNVNIEALNSYSQKLAEHRTSVGEVHGKIDEADVGDEAWGVVGLFVKQDYSDLLERLKGLMTEMENGLQAASEKVGTAARLYQEAEDGHQRSLSTITGSIESTTVNQLEA